MLKEIQLAGSVRTPFGSFCGAFADVSAIELGKAAVERCGVKPEDVKEFLVGNILERRPPPKGHAPDRDRGGASAAAEWESQWPLN
jgi:acetyl-CoA acetyltransferase